MANIYYVRHGQASLFSDNYDNLSELGWEQAHVTGSYFKDQKMTFDRVYVGPLVRHGQTLEGITNKYNTSSRKLPEPIVLDSLLEHEGPKVIKTLLPQLIMENDHLNKLASVPSETKKEKIKNYMRLFEEVMTMWVNEELDDKGVEHQSWSEFRIVAGQALAEIREHTQPKENVLVITSGGPVAIAVAETLDLTNLKAMETAWTICNCSITTFLKTRRRCSVFNMNTVPAFDDQRLVTLV